MDLASEVKKAIRQSPVGKKLPDHLYIHESALHELPELLQELVVDAEVLSDIEGYDLAKIARDGRSVSFLGYPLFFKDPHPALAWSVFVNLETGDVRQRSWGSSKSPPILHRKETFLSPSHPLYETFAELTRQEAELGLLSRPSIGTRRRWDDLLEQEGVYVDEDHEVRTAAASEPYRGDRVRTTDYGYQDYLYHWTWRGNLPFVLKEGLQPGCGENWEEQLRENCEGRVFLSTEPDKWASSYPDPIAVRVMIDDVECYYDGGEWIDYEDEEYFEGRLADCYSEKPIPPELLEVVE